MSQLKQNILVVAILFVSLLSSVALSYVITPNQTTMTEKSHINKVMKTDESKPSKAMNKAVLLLLPKVAD